MKYIISTFIAAAYATSENHKTFAQIALDHGYSVESYTVVTDDGYISEMYRLPGRLTELGNDI